MKSIRRRATELLAEISTSDLVPHVNSSPNEPTAKAPDVDPDVRAFIDMVVDAHPAASVADLAPQSVLSATLFAESLANQGSGHSGQGTVYAELAQSDIPGYKLGSEIGRGGQAVVYSGYQKATGLKVAIKILIGGAFYSAQSMARFDREIQILTILDHPNIVKIIDRGTSMSGEPFLVMNFIEGKQFDHWLVRFRAKHGPMPRREDFEAVFQLFLKICDAVNSAHIRGIVHRDIKPSNILIDERGEPHILDFGLARTVLKTMTQETDPQAVSLTGQFIGSLLWASPEQAQGATSNIDMRTDVYSLGVMLYQILTGEFPYGVTKPMPALLQCIINDVPVAPSRRVTANRKVGDSTPSKNYRVPLDPILIALDAVALKALAKSRNDRQQTAREVAADIVAALATRPSAPPENAWWQSTFSRVVGVFQKS